MAINITHVINNLNNVCDNEKIIRVEKFIDDQLINPEHCMKIIQGPMDDFYFKFTIVLHLNIHEINLIKSKYIDAGWGNVVVEPHTTHTDIYLLKNNNPSNIVNNGV